MAYFEFELRLQQEKAFEYLKEFALQESDRVFILKGYAGTGKTTLMGGFIKWLDEQEILFSLLASTGRAAKILSDKTKSPANTVHSHIYKFRDIDDDLEELSKVQEDMAVDDKGQLSLVFDLRSVEEKSRKIYIVDEASMIADEADKSLSFAKFGSGELLKDLLRFDPDGRFVFVGDPCQLPPIGQDISPALVPEYVKRKFNLSVRHFELTEIIRQASGNGIIQASLKLRQMHQSNPAGRWPPIPLKGYNDIHLYNSHPSLVNEYLNRVKSHGFDYTTLICQTNRHCSDLNKIIRSSLGKNPDHLQAGDILMVTQNNYLSWLVNGDMVKVLKTGNREYRCGLSFLQVEVEEMVSKRVHKLLLVEDILNNITTNLDQKQHKNLMIDYFKRMSSNGIKQKDLGFKTNMMSDPYLNALKAVYGYAITCHKGQGGEWKEVFLYLDNKIMGIPRPGLFQWIYTAVTRAKNSLHIVNDWFIK